MNKIKQVIGELRSQIGQDMDINPSAKKVYLSKLDYLLQSPSDQGEAARLREALVSLPDQIMQIDSWADVEELTFPLENPTAEEQNEWFETFCIHLGDHVRGLVDEALSSHTEDATVANNATVEGTGIQKVRETNKELRMKAALNNILDISSDEFSRSQARYGLGITIPGITDGGEQND